MALFDAVPQLHGITDGKSLSFVRAFQNPTQIDQVSLATSIKAFRPCYPRQRQQREWSRKLAYFGWADTGKLKHRSKSLQALINEAGLRLTDGFQKTPLKGPRRASQTLGSLPYDLSLLTPNNLQIQLFASPQAISFNTTPHDNKTGKSRIEPNFSRASTCRRHTRPFHPNAERDVTQGLP